MPLLTAAVDWYEQTYGIQLDANKQVNQQCDWPRDASLL
jgi:hypothetical protein